MRFRASGGIVPGGVCRRKAATAGRGRELRLRDSCRAVRCAVAHAARHLGSGAVAPDAEPLRDFADHRHSSVVRSPDHRSRPCCAARSHHSVDVSQIEAAGGQQAGADAGDLENSYVELVVSSSKTLVEKSRQEIIDLALAELREFFPGARAANLVKATVIKEVHATYSPRPGIESLPAQSGDGLAPHLSGGRLDGHRMAGHHGRRGAQRLRRRAMRSPSRRTARCSVPGAGPGAGRFHAAVRMTAKARGDSRPRCQAEPLCWISTNTSRNASTDKRPVRRS